jgi:hypothetical protein
VSILSKVRGQREAIKLNNAGRTRAYKFKVGKTVISLLPLHSDLSLSPNEQGFTRDFGMHYIKNSKGENIVTVGDRETTYGETCPIREGLVDMIRYANSIGDDDMAEAAKKSLGRKNVLMNAVVHQDPDKKAEAVPQLIQMSESLYDQLAAILEEYLTEDEEAALRWNDRLAFVVEREGTGVTDTRYKIYPAAKRLNVKPDVMNQAVNLEEYVTAQFQESVTKALSFIATSTGRAIEGSAFAAALTARPGSAPALSAPVTVAAEDDDLLAEAPSKAGSPALEASRTEDAVFEDVADDDLTGAASAPAKSEASADDLLAEIDALAA